MRCCSMAMRSLVACWIKAITPTVKMANTPRIWLLRSTERPGVSVFSILLSLALALAHTTAGPGMAVGPWRGVVIDGRRAQVHQQHGKGHGIRIVAPDPNHIHQHAHARAEYQAPTGAGSGADGVGDDEECAQHGRTTEQMKQRRAVAGRTIAIPEQQAHQCQCPEHAHRRMPAVDTLVERSEERRVGKECRSRWPEYH